MKEELSTLFFADLINGPSYVAFTVDDVRTCTGTEYPKVFLSELASSQVSC
jgi:hypothetical protein